MAMPMMPLSWAWAEADAPSATPPARITVAIVFSKFILVSLQSALAGMDAALSTAMPPAIRIAGPLAGTAGVTRYPAAFLRLGPPKPVRQE
jgi:hypothetical protein